MKLLLISSFLISCTANMTEEVRIETIRKAKLLCKCDGGINRLVVGSSNSALECNGGTKYFFNIRDYTPSRDCKALEVSGNE